MREAQPGGMSAAQCARLALEHVCSGAGLAELADFYHRDFVDRVNGRTYRGHQGVRESVQGYQRLFKDLRFEVAHQVVEGEWVASRFVVHGTHRRRAVRFTGMVFSRLRDGKIIEDVAVTDQVQLLRQLGWWRALLLVVDGRRPGAARRRPSLAASCTGEP